MSNLMLVLDLDETLIHSRPLGSKKPCDFTIRFRTGEQYGVCKRPGLDNFVATLRRLMRHSGLRVSVWTAADEAYAHKILDQIWATWRKDLTFLRTRRHCTTLENGAVVKDLRCLPRSYVTLLVDDNPDTYALNSFHGFAPWKMKPFRASAKDADDNQLSRVLACVRQLMRKLTPRRPLAHPS